MQFQLKLTKGEGRSILPLSYRYGFSRAISNLVGKASGNNQTPDCSSFRDRISTSFTFGNFTFDTNEILHQEELIFHQGNELTLEIRFLIDDDEEDLIKEMFLNQHITVGDTTYEISQINAKPTIDFQDVMVYRCLCPISLIKNNPSGSTLFLSPKDKGFHKSLKIDLLKRLLRSHPEMSGLQDLDQYCPEFQFQLLSEPKEKGYNIKTNCSFQTVIGYQFDFQLKASPVLHELGFYEGFGLGHSMGLGFVEVLA